MISISVIWITVWIFIIIEMKKFKIKQDLFLFFTSGKIGVLYKALADQYLGICGL